MTMSDYELEIRRRLWRRRIRAAGRAVGGIMTTALFVAIAWAFVHLTPPQRSAEADLFDHRIKMMEGGAQ